MKHIKQTFSAILAMPKMRTFSRCAFFYFSRFFHYAKSLAKNIAIRTKNPANSTNFTNPANDITPANPALIAFKAFVKKEFLHIFRDVRTMMILILMPIVQILLFGFALSSEVKDIKFALFNPAKSPLSEQILAHFIQSPYFNLQTLITSKSQLERLFDDKNIDMALLFPHNFNLQNGNKNIQIILDASDPNRASSIAMQSSVIFSQALLQEQKYAQNNDLKRINISSQMLFNPQSKSAYNFVPGLMGMLLMLICAMMTSVSIVREKEQGSMEILLTCPIKPELVIMAKIMPYLLLSCTILGIILGLCVSVLDIVIKGNVGLLFCFCLLYLFLALSIGLLVSNIAKTQIVAMLVCAMIFMMPIMMLSGMMFPIESMPKILQYLSHIIPTKWFILGVKKIMIEGLGIGFVWKEMTILSAMLLGIIFLSLKTFKIRL